MSRILIVEDDDDVRTLVRTNLMVKGYDVEEAVTGPAALEAAKSSAFDLIVLDVMLPELDGFEVLDALRSDIKTEQVPVIVLTAKTGEEDRVRGLVGGAQDFIPKPFFATELLLRIDRLLGAKAQTDSLRDITITDNVTGAHNRRYFEMRAEQECAHARSDSYDVALYVVDIQGIHKGVRAAGWKKVDQVLAAVGEWIRGDLAEGEETFWVSPSFLVLAPHADVARAKERSHDLKKGVADVLTANRKKVDQLMAYSGFTFFDPAETVDEFLDRAAQAPYRRLEISTPQEERAKREEGGAEKAFGGRLTGLSPVTPEEAPGKPQREARAKKTPKLSRSVLSREMRGLSDAGSVHARPARPDEPTTTSQDQSSATETLEPETVTAGAESPPAIGDRTEFMAHLREQCLLANAEEHDLAIYVIETEAAGASGDGDSEDSESKQAEAEQALSVWAQSALEPGEHGFFVDGRLVVVAPGADVPGARRRAAALKSGAAEPLAPFRGPTRLTPLTGFVFFEFDETPNELAERAWQAPHRGAPPITPLEARRRALEEAGST